MLQTIFFFCLKMGMSLNQFLHQTAIRYRPEQLHSQPYLHCEELQHKLVQLSACGRKPSEEVCAVMAAMQTAESRLLWQPVLGGHWGNLEGCKARRLSWRTPQVYLVP